MTTYLKYIETEGFNDLPKITIVDPENLNEYFGAYAPSTQTIYISSALATSPSVTDVVLMHEYAHYLAKKYLENKYVSDSTINRFVAAPCISKEVRSYQRNQGVQPMNNGTDLRRQISW